MLMSKKLRGVVMLSGNGTTLQNFIDLSERGELPLEIALVISSKKYAYGIERAKKHNIPTVVIARKDYKTWEDFNHALTDAVNQVQPNIILLAGFLSLFRPGAQYHGKIMNSHPALIPSFCGHGMYGHRVHHAVVESGTKITGATIHFVDEQYDTGPIILQKAVEVLPGDTPDSLAERVQAVEREIYPEAVRLFAEGRLRIVGKCVEILPI